MDSNVQIVSHVCTVCADVQLAAASSTNRGVHVHTRAPVILAWRVLRGETPHLRERWRKATPEGKVGDLDYEGGRRHTRALPLYWPGAC